MAARPTKVGVALADVATGMHAAVGILAALAGRERQGSPAHGIGQRVDVSIFESTLAILVNQAQNAFVEGVAPGRLGNAHPNIVPYETFETADGEIAVAVGSERQWPRFCLALGLPALADDPRFATNGDRVTNRAELLATLRERLAEQTVGGVAGGPRRGRHPGRPDQRHPDGVRVGAGRGPRAMAVAVEHPVLGPDDAGRAAVRASATPAEIRTRRRRCSASMPTRSSPRAAGLLARRTEIASASAPPGAI